MSDLEIVAFIKNEREKKGLSMRELATKSGVRPATISDLENGHTKGTLPTICSLLASLGFELKPTEVINFSKI